MEKESKRGITPKEEAEHRAEALNEELRGLAIELERQARKLSNNKLEDINGKLRELIKQVESQVELDGGNLI